MTSPSSASASDYRFLFLMIPSLFILSLAIGLFEFSSNITVDNFHYLTNRLMHPDSERSTHSFNPAHFLVEVKSRYLWLTTVVIMLVAGLYASILCGMIVYQSHPRPRMAVVAGVGILLAAMGLFSLSALDETHTLYRAVFAFSYENLRQAGPERISPELLRYAKTVVSLINVEAVVVPVVAILAACSTLASPLRGDQADPDFCATQMKRLKEVLGASSAVLVAGVLHMGAWLRWPAALISDKAAHEAVLGAAMAVTLFWGVTFTLMLVSTYLPAAFILAKRAQALLQADPDTRSPSAQEAWLKQHGLFLSLHDHVPQFGLMLAPLMASPLSSLLLAPLAPSG